MYYVYVYLDPRKKGRFFYKGMLSFSHEPFYIGKGKGDRSQTHLERVKNGDLKNFSNIRFYKRLREILSDNKEPFIEIVKRTDDEDEAYNHESALIQMIGRSGYGEGPLLNICNGIREKDGIPFSVDKKYYEKFNLLCNMKGKKTSDFISEIIKYQINLQWNEELEEIYKTKTEEIEEIEEYNLPGNPASLTHAKLLKMSIKDRSKALRICRSIIKEIK